MGLIKAAIGAAGGVLADQWREFFYCDSLDETVLVTKGEKRTGGRSFKQKGRGQHNFKRFRYSRCGRSVHDYCRSGKGRRDMRRARRVYL